MTTPEPTVAHVEAVARALRQQFGEHRVDSRISAHRAMTLTNPDAQAALAANLPREVMLAALVADGTLDEDEQWAYDGLGPEPHRRRRLVTSWETP